MRSACPDGQGALAPPRCGLGHGDVGHAAGAQDSDRQQTDGPGTGHQHAVVRSDAREIDRVQRDRSRLGERGGAGVEFVGHEEQAVRSDDLVAAERTAGEVEEVGRLASQAHRRPTALARPAFTAARCGVRDNTRANGPFAGIDVGADRRDRPRPFVAEDRAGPRVALEDEVQIGAADAAVRHLDEHLAGPERGNWQLLHLDLALADVHRGAHQVIGHPLSFAHGPSSSLSSRALRHARRRMHAPPVSCTA